MPTTLLIRPLRTGLAAAVLAFMCPGAFAADTRTGEQVYIGDPAFRPK